MKNLRRLLLGLPAGILLASVLVVPAAARDGVSGNDGENETTIVSQSTSTSSDSGSGDIKPSPEFEKMREEALKRVENAQKNAAGSVTIKQKDKETVTRTQEDAQQEIEDAMHSELKARGLALLEQAKKQNKDANKTPEDRQKTCEQRKNGLQNKVTNLQSNAQKLLGRISDVSTKAQDYQQTNQLTVANWDTLLAAVTAAQTKATASVNALKDLKPTIDCTSNTVATDVATFKAAAASARDDLQGYRQAVRALLTALEAAKPASATTTGGNQ